jgi:hypothetical protein
MTRTAVRTEVRTEVSTKVSRRNLLASGACALVGAVKQCWETQINFIGGFDLERVAAGPDDAFVKYLCHTTNGKSLRNVEYLRVKNGKIESIECYFGAQSSFPSAVSNGQK